MFNKLVENIKKNREYKQADKAASIFKAIEEYRKQEVINRYTDVDNVIWTSEEFQKWVDEDDRRTIEAVQNGEKYWLWDTKDFASKLYFDAVKMCGVLENYQYQAVYIAVIAKYIEDEEVLNVLKRWYETGEIEYNKILFGETIYMNAYHIHDHPITALFKRYMRNTKQLPQPAFLEMENLYIYDVRYRRNSGVELKKISDDGLHLVECSEYDFNEATDNHFLNMSEEEQDKEIERIRKKGEIWMKENGYYD